MARIPLTAKSLGWLIIGTGALAYCLAALVVARGTGRLTTYPGHTGLLAAITISTGLLLLVAGLVVVLARPTDLSGPLAIVGAVLWMMPVWVGWESGPPVIRSAALATEVFLIAVLVHLFLSYPTGRINSGPARLIVISGYSWSAFVGVTTALFFDPFRDPNCWSICSHNTFLIKALPGAMNAIRTTDRWFCVGTTLAAATLLVVRLVGSTSPARRALWPVLPAATIQAAATVGFAIVAQEHPAEDPGNPSYQAVFLLRCGANVLLAAALLWALVRDLNRRRAVAGIVAGIAEQAGSGSLESALRTSLRDPALTIAFWLPESQRFVDSGGQPVSSPRADSATSVTTIARNNQTVAAIVHSVPDLDQKLGPSARLALENELLRVELLAQLEDLRASRARVIERGDAHRRKLERDLHDGAQSHLVAVMHDLRVTTSTAASAGDDAAAAVLVEANPVLRAAVSDLRRLAHGLYPAMLGQAGLAAALRALAMTAPLPVEIGRTLETRYSAAVEITAYRVITDSIEDAARRGATYTEVSIEEHDNHVVVTVEHDAAESGEQPIYLLDRVGAMGGRMWASPGLVSAVIPCE